MRILVIGSGGREHALAWKLAASPQTDKLYAAPGNGGTSRVAENVDIMPGEIDKLVDWCMREKIDLVVPGPELPLTLGIADALAEAGIACAGPDKFCARLEGSKSFAKEIMARAGVPTAKSRKFTNLEEARAHILAGPHEVVIKADGLAAGKGVVVASSHQEAIDAAVSMLADNKFGDAGASILVEERLRGEEASLICLCDGRRAVPLPSCQDHKRALDNDKGPNTGGMGAYSPAPLLPDSMLEEAADLTVRPVLKTLADMGHPYRGVIYAGLMLTDSGIKVLEYNVRFGDPECQPLMARLKSDLAEHLSACCSGSLDKERIVFDQRPALGVVLCSKGYPGQCPKGQPITGINEAEGSPDTVVFHGATKQTANGTQADGGRVLCVTSLGVDLKAAKTTAYDALAKIHMPQSAWRKDIGEKGLLRSAPQA